MKDEVRIINCVRGILMVEKYLITVLKSDGVKGAGVDVFEVESSEQKGLFNMKNVICTPNLSVSIFEA